MSRPDDLADLYAELKELKARLRKMEVTAPVGYTSVNEGALRVASEEGLIVEGSARVTGTLQVTGVINGDGTITWTGPATFTGPLTVEGTTTISGDTDISGDLDVTGPASISGSLAVSGVTTVSDDLNVTTGGRILIEGSPSLELGQTAYGAGLEFSNGGIVAAEGTGLGFYSNPGAGLFVGPLGGSLTLGADGFVLGLSSCSVAFGANRVSIDSVATRITGQIKISTAETVTGVSPNCFIGADGRVRRIV